MSNILPGLTDVVVVVHGIGDQKRNATVRSVASRLAESKALRGKSNPVAPQPHKPRTQQPLQMLLTFLSTLASSARISASPGRSGPPDETVPSILSAHVYSMLSAI